MTRAGDSRREELTVGTPDATHVADPARGSIDRNARLAAIVFALVVAGAAALYFVMGRHQWFFYDEWDFLAARSAWSLDDLFRPHNEHWSTLPILFYRAVWWAFGLHSYRPYQIGTIGVHLTVGVLLRIVMRRSGVSPWLATAAATLFVLLGSGRQDIIWAFQIGYVGSLAFGIGHLLLAVHDGPVDRRDYFGLALGLAGLMSSGIAVTMVVVVGVAVLLTRGWRVAALHTVPLGTLYLGWWLIVGNQGHIHRITGLDEALSFIWNGTSASFDAMGQLPGMGLALAAMLLVGLAVAFRSDPKSIRGRLAMPSAPVVRSRRVPRDQFGGTARARVLRRESLHAYRRGAHPAGSCRRSRCAGAALEDVSARCVRRDLDRCPGQHWRTLGQESLGRGVPDGARPAACAGGNGGTP